MNDQDQILQFQEKNNRELIDKYFREHVPDENRQVISSQEGSTGRGLLSSTRNDAVINGNANLNSNLEHAANQSLEQMTQLQQLERQSDINLTQCNNASIIIQQNSEEQQPPMDENEELYSLTLEERNKAVKTLNSFFLCFGGIFLFVAFSVGFCNYLFKASYYFCGNLVFLLFRAFVSFKHFKSEQKLYEVNNGISYLQFLTQRLFSNCGAIAITILVYVYIVKKQGINLVISAAILLIHAIIWYCCNRELSQKKQNRPYLYTGLIIRLYVMIQFINVALKISGVVSWSYHGVFWPTLFMFILISFYLLGILILLLCTIYYIIKKEANFKQLNGLFWSFNLVLLLDFSIVFIPLSFVNYMQNDYDLGMFSLIVELICAWIAFIIVYTVIVKESLICFIGIINSDRILFNSNQQNNQDHHQNQQFIEVEKRQIVLQKQEYIPDNMPHYLMSDITKEIASKLFKPSHSRQHSMAKIAANKDKCLELSNQQLNASLIQNKHNYSSVSSPGCQEKSSHHRQLSKITGVDVSFQLCDLNAETLQNEEGGSIYQDQKLKMPIPQSVRKDDHNITDNNQNDNTVVQCLICFDNLPDSVLMDCGHGGICNECATEIWQKGNECYLCRQPITSILQVDLAHSGEYKPIISITKEINEELLTSLSQLNENIEKK